MEKEKQKYINDNIIEKGYNPEDLSNYITRIRGVGINSFSLNELKKLIEDFKTEQLNISLKSVNVKKNKKSTPFEILYSDCEFESKTSKQQETKLMEFEKEKKRINIKISEPIKEKKSFFSKEQIIFLITSEELNSSTRRSYTDFEWFKNQLNSRYPFILVPPLLKEDFLSNINISIFSKSKNNEISIVEKENLDMKVRYLTRFMNGVLRKKILRTSPITFQFLTLDESNFEKYKKNLDSNPFNLNINLTNFKTIKGEIKVTLTKDKAIYVNNLLRIMVPTIDLYNKLKNSFNILINDLNLISNHMKEISVLFDKLSTQAKDIKQSNEMKKIYSDLNNIFSTWSNLYLSQSKFFKEDFLEYFDYMNMEYNELDTIMKQFQNQRNEYESFANNLNLKKEELFESREISKWEVKEGTEKDIPFVINDKKKAFEIMCYKENRVIEFEKRIIVIAINVIIEQFKKLKKYQGERIKQYFQKINSEKEIVFGDIYTLIKLISTTLEM